jgi:hypothetical protein
MSDFGTLGGVKHVSVGLASACLVLVACASSGSDAPPDASRAPDAGGEIDGEPAPDAGGTPLATCPEGQLAIGVASDGTLACATVSAATADAVAARCAIYAGFRDNCDGCADAPAKWSSAGPGSCSAGSGGGNACVTATLDDGGAVSLAALDLDGDVNGDDKFYASIHCVAAPREPRPAPCAPGWAISARGPTGTWLCTPLSEAAVDYVGGRCSVYLGWRDNCDGCTTAPAKWGHASDASCTTGEGGDDTCVTTVLDGETVNLIGVNTDGDVNGDDKFYVGMTCGEPDAIETTTTTECPAGRFMVGTNTDGSFNCGDPAAMFGDYVRDSCALFLGWRDSCGGCTEPPTKWGRVGLASCATGGGTDDTCIDATLGAATLPMFGLSTDGNVNDDDTLYLGLRCTP